jgi:hypothetical protein
MLSGSPMKGLLPMHKSPLGKKEEYEGYRMVISRQE